MADYKVAFTTEAGTWDVVETFEADNDGEAECYAEREYPDKEWYVLDADGDNINA